MHHPGRKHSNADALSRYPCRQCGRMSHFTEQPVAVITTGNLVGGYSKQELQQAQREDSCVGEILAAKEHDERPSSQYAKGQNIPYR